MASKKIDKEFRYTDDSVNVYGFRLLTSGYLMEEFQKNPIGFYMHGECVDYPRESGVLVRWEDFRKEGDAVYAKPVINLEHPRGERTAKEIEEGFLNGASVGKIIALEISEDPSLMLPGQSGPTVTKWYHRELSPVDIPGNFTALALFDKDGQAINLADFKNQNSIMKQIFLTPEMLQAMNLSDTSDQAAALAAFNDLVAKAKKVDDLQSKLTTALADKTTAETNLADLKKETTEKQVTAMLETALSDKKITVALQKTLATQFAGKPDELKALLADMTPVTSITTQLKNEDSKLNEQFRSLSYAELDKKGLLPSLKAADIDLFKQKFKEEYKTDYKG